MRFPLSLSFLLLVAASSASGQDIRYVSDTQYIPLRAGPGGNYTVTHRGIPSGTRLKVNNTSPDGEFTQITTDRGTSGWIRTQYLMKDLPAQNKLTAAVKRAAALEEKNAALASEASTLKSEQVGALDQIQSTEGQLQLVTQALAELKQISGKAVQLDIDNRRLVIASETLQSDLEMVNAENMRLADKVESEAFVNGALAVLLGVIITLVVPRLWPKRRTNSEWA